MTQYDNERNIKQTQAILLKPHKILLNPLKINVTNARITLIPSDPWFFFSRNTGIEDKDKGL